MERPVQKYQGYPFNWKEPKKGEWQRQAREKGKNEVKTACGEKTDHLGVPG